VLNTLGLTYLIYPDKVAEIYRFIINANNKILLILFLFSLPIIYTLGAATLSEGETSISKHFNTVTEDQLINELRFHNFSQEIEENLKIHDFIYASEENIWINESNRFYEYSNFFAGVTKTLTFSIIFLLLIIFAILITSKNFFWPILKLLLPLIILILSTSTKKITNPLIISTVHILVLGIILWEFRSLLTAIVIIIFIFPIFSSSSLLSIFYRKKANSFLVLGATSNKTLKFNNTHLSDNGNGQHLCSPQDSSTKPQ